MKDQKSGPHRLNLFTRRDFILIVGSIFLFSLGTIRLLSGLFFRRFTHSHHLSNLSKISKNTLVELYPIMTAQEDPKQTQRALKQINRYLTNLSSRTKLELELALLFLNQATLLIGSLAPFPYLSHEKKLAYLHYLSTGPRLFAPIFLGLKEVCYLGHYALEENFYIIPNYETLVSSNGDPDPEFNETYEKLEAMP